MFQAKASSVGTATSFLPVAYTSPFTVLSPTLRPVNEPGPTAKAKTSISLISNPDCASTWSISGIRRSECVTFTLIRASATSVSLSMIATPPSIVDVSIASSLIVTYRITYSDYLGRVKLKVLPFPCMLSAQISPLWASMIVLAMDRPRPDPFPSLEAR